MTALGASKTNRMPPMSLVDSVRKLIVPIHKEGYVFIAIGAVATLVLGQLWAPFGWLGTLITLWICYFFRDPVRMVPQREGLVVSPADGRISQIGTALPPPELELPAEVSIASALRSLSSLALSSSAFRKRPGV